MTSSRAVCSARVTVRFLEDVTGCCNVMRTEAAKRWPQQAAFGWALLQMDGKTLVTIWFGLKGICKTNSPNVALASLFQFTKSLFIRLQVSNIIYFNDQSCYNIKGTFIPGSTRENKKTFPFWFRSFGHVWPSTHWCRTKQLGWDRQEASVSYPFKPWNSSFAVRTQPT